MYTSALQTSRGPGRFSPRQAELSGLRGLPARVRGCSPVCELSSTSELHAIISFGPCWAVTGARCGARRRGPRSRCCSGTFAVGLRCNRWMLRRSQLVVAVAAAVLISGGSAEAATIEVNNLGDEGVGCTLRTAIEDVNSPLSNAGACAPASTGSNTIVLPSGTIMLEQFHPKGELAFAPTGGRHCGHRPRGSSRLA